MTKYFWRPPEIRVTDYKILFILKPSPWRWTLIRALWERKPRAKPQGPFLKKKRKSGFSKNKNKKNTEFVHLHPRKTLFWRREWVSCRGNLTCSIKSEFLSVCRPPFSGNLGQAPINGWLLNCTINIAQSFNFNHLPTIQGVRGQTQTLLNITSKHGPHVYKKPVIVGYQHNDLPQQSNYLMAD